MQKIFATWFLLPVFIVVAACENNEPLASLPYGFITWKIGNHTMKSCGSGIHVFPEIRISHK